MAELGFATPAQEIDFVRSIPSTLPSNQVEFWLDEAVVAAARPLLERVLCPDWTASLSGFDIGGEAGGVYSGIDQHARAMRGWLEAYEHLGGELDAVVHLGDRILTLTRVSGRMRRDGVDFAYGAGDVSRLGAGCLARSEFYLNRADALAAAGLPEIDSDTVAAWALSQEAWYRGDIDRYVSMLHPEIEIVTDPAWPEPGPWHGHDAARRFFADYREMLGSGRMIVDEMAVGEGGLFVAWRHLVTGAASGVGVVNECSNLVSTRDGMPVRIEFIYDIEAGRQAAGLSSA